MKPISPPIEKLEHPSFGVLSIGHQTNNRTNLFGSTETPSTCVSLTLSHAVLEHRREHHRCHVYPTDRIVEILLSPLQFAQLLAGQTSLAEGVPCTINWLGGKFNPPLANTPTTRLEFLQHDFQAEMEDLGEQCAAFLEQAKSLRDKPAVGRADRTAFVSLAEGLIGKITNMTPFIATRMATVIEEMRAELATDKRP